MMLALMAARITVTPDPDACRIGQGFPLADPILQYECLSVLVQYRTVPCGTSTRTSVHWPSVFLSKAVERDVHRTSTRTVHVQDAICIPDGR